MEQDVELVFVVDDEASVRKALCRLLRSAGFRTEEFASAEEFLERPRYCGVGCLVVDVHMPRLSGLDLQEALIREGCCIPIIFVSGLDDILRSGWARDSTAMELLLKPLGDEELLAAVDRALAKSRAARKPSRAPAFPPTTISPP